MTSRTGILIGILVFGSIAAVAYFRTGLLNLPTVSGAITVSDAGLENLEGLKARDHNMADISRGNEETGLRQLQEAMLKEPTNIVIGNKLRMETLKLRRRWLVENAGKSEIALNFPEYLNDQPTRFLRGLV